MSFNNKEVFEFYNNTLSYAATGRHFGIDYRTVKRAVAKYHEENSFAQKKQQELVLLSTEFHIIGLRLRMKKVMMSLCLSRIKQMQWSTRKFEIG